MSQVLQEITAALRAKLDNFKILPSATVGHAYQGTLNVLGKKVDIKIEIEDLSFIKLPLIYLLDPINQLPKDVFPVHVEYHNHNRCCYAQPGELILELQNPAGSILRCVEQTEEVLKAIFDKKDITNEIRREFLPYWNGSLIYTDIVSNKNKLQYVFWSYKHIRSLVSNRTEIINCISETAGSKPDFNNPAIIFKTKAFLEIFPQEKAPETLGQLYDWLARIDKNLLEELKKHITQYKIESMILIESPNATCGFIIRYPDGMRKLLEKGKGGFKSNASVLQTARGLNYTISRVSTLDCSPENVVKRNMPGKKNYENLKITLVGCGTIGSHLAKFLIQSGAGIGDKGKLTLIDTDIIHPGNLGRHFLGYGWLGEAKATACKKELLKFYPTANIEAINSNALECGYVMKSSDLVINSTGDYNFSNALNHLAVKERKSSKFPWVLHVMLFGHGEAAQAILEGDPEFACYKCLRPILAPEMPWRTWPLDYSEEKFKLTPATCGDGAYAPYAVSSSVVAASLALEIGLDYFNGEAKEKKYFRNRRINMKHSKNIADKNMSKHERCPTCST